MEKEYADIIIDISHEKLDRTFQYRIPDRWRNDIHVGSCVMVPFGAGNRLIKGYCIGIGDTCRFDPERIKELTGVIEDKVALESSMIELAAWIRAHYGSTMIQALKTVIPSGKSVKKLEHKTIERIATKEETISAWGESIRRKQVAKERLLAELTKQETIPYQWVTGKLGVSAATIRSLEKMGIVRIVTTSSYRNPVKDKERHDSLVMLSDEQHKTVDSIMASYDRGERKPALIHGITGSGKTEVYMQLVEKMVARGRQVIVLIPEIALTYQTLLRFYNRFGDRVSVMNSTLSPGEKFDQCERAKAGEIDVIIGPRSALFTPFPKLGMIIIDEEHEGSYKSEMTPKYHARETAIHIAQMQQAMVVMGSATPSMEAYYHARQADYQLYTLNRRLTGGSLPRVSIVDLREELKQGNRSIFSIRLQELLRDRLQKGQQSILFINRRGYAGFISCRSCGEVMKCPHCDVSMSEHKDGTLQCHYCGYRIPKPARCPKCGSKYIGGFKAGTQQIEEKLRELLPGVRTLRMDADTTRTKDSYEQILSAFSNGEADVLIGTQMIVKGHDFPKVTLVGVLAADLSLGSNDYRCAERTFQLLTQAVGRAGRGELPGEAIIQTYQPDHYAITYAAEQDYAGFYEEEMAYRELGGYPPAAHMLAVQIFSKTEEGGKHLSERLAQVVRQAGRVTVLGPAPATISKINDIFRFVFYIKSAEYDKLIYEKDILEEIWNQEDQRTESVFFDFDPMNTI